MVTYLRERNQQIIIGDIASAYVFLEYGVPHGSVLGPKMYSLYTRPLGDVIRHHQQYVHFYARSIVNKKNELNIMVEDIDPHIIGITESWANIDITDAEFGLTGYVMFRKDRIGRRGGGVILYVKKNLFRRIK